MISSMVTFKAVYIIEWNLWEFIFYIGHKKGRVKPFLDHLQYITSKARLWPFGPYRLMKLWEPLRPSHPQTHLHPPSILFTGDIF